MKPAVMRPLLLGTMLSVLSFSSHAEIPANVMAQFSQLSPAQQEAVAAQYGISLDQIRGQAQTPAQEQKATPTLAPRTVDAANQSQRLSTAVTRTEKGTLQPFGYNVFAGQPTSQTPLADIPVPDDYIVGPGDELRVQMYGKENASYKLKVNRDGSVEFPKLGPINVAGQSFEQVSAMLQQRISEQFIGVESAISMGSLRTIQVFVMGDAYRPGAYNVNALTTVTQALQIAGGIDTVGSLRKVQVKRGGAVIQNVDLYKMLIWGNTAQDIRLRAGDTIFIPAKGSEVTIDGLVKRPGIYELSGPAGLGNVLEVAGGLKAEALREVTVTRRGQNGMQVFNLNMANGRDNAFTVHDGDKIEAKPTTTEFSNAIAVKGAVIREGTYAYQAGTRVSQLLQNPRRDLKATADLDYALVVREINPRHDIEVLQFNLGMAIAHPGDIDDLVLQPRDQILVFNRGQVDTFGQMAAESKAREQQKRAQTQQGENEQEFLDQGQQQRTALKQQGLAKDQIVDVQTGAVVSSNALNDRNRLTLQDSGEQLIDSNKDQADSREALLAPVIAKLKAQSGTNAPVQLAEVRGEVRFPGVYPLPQQPTLGKLVLAAGGLKESASVAEVSRIDDVAGDLQITNLRFELSDLATANGSPRAMSKDNLNILANPRWREEVSVKLFGEVKYPGTYRVQRGDTIGNLIKRAGGLTEFANPKGVVFAREFLRKQEQERLVFLREQLQEAIATMTLRRQTGTLGARTSSPAEASELVGKMQTVQAIGRMSINMPAILSGDKQADVMLENGDKLYIPMMQKVVSVAGQVQMPSAHVYDPSLSVQDYLDKAGGTKKQADTDRIYVIKADGSVMLPENSWYARRNDQLEPGDTIIAPIDTDYLDNLSVWSTATQMMYQLGVAWAAIKN